MHPYKIQLLQKLNFQDFHLWLENFVTPWNCGLPMRLIFTLDMWINKIHVKPQNSQMIHEAPLHSVVWSSRTKNYQTIRFWKWRRTSRNRKYRALQAYAWNVFLDPIRRCGGLLISAEWCYNPYCKDHNNAFERAFLELSKKWSTRSPDLSSKFFHRGYFKHRVYTNEPQILNQHKIQREIGEVFQEKLRYFTNSINLWT